jgi:hypothetical protein
VTPPLKRLQTMATLKPRPSRAPSRFSPAREARASRTSPVQFRLVTRGHRALEQVTHPLALRAQVVDVERSVGLLSIGTRSTMLSPKPSRPPYFDGVVRHQAHRRDAEVHQDLRADAVLARVDRQAELEVGVDGVAAVFLQGVRADLVAEANAAALVAAQVHDDAGAFGRDLGQRRLQLRARSRSASNPSRRRSDTPSEPARARRRLGDVAVDQRHVLLAVEDVLKDVGLELTVLGGQRRLGDALHQLLVSGAGSG